MFTKEPAVVFKIIEEIIRAAIPMALIFGWVQWTEAQTGTVMLFIGVVVGGLSVLLTRSQTVPTETVDKQIKVAVNSPVGTSVEEVVEAAKDK
jgi:hypothetical protein